MANLKTEVARKQSTSNFPKNKHFLPCDTHVRVKMYHVRITGKCSFFGKFGVVCFLVISVLRFAPLPYYRRIDRCFPGNFAKF